MNPHLIAGGVVAGIILQFVLMFVAPALGGAFLALWALTAIYFFVWGIMRL